MRLGSARRRAQTTTTDSEPCVRRESEKADGGAPCVAVKREAMRDDRQAVRDDREAVRDGERRSEAEALGFVSNKLS
ncbi:hypothetical protein Scep_028235 [Stephania cephalantha]|uniref:Uncharacterized protein n=1 Tax=Stephania cephalantha TaxID=152367 RepID=A0AAP0EGX0_9MAGN